MEMEKETAPSGNHHNNYMVYIFENREEKTDPIQTSVEKAVQHWKASGVGLESAKFGFCKSTKKCKKSQFSLIYLFKLFSYPPGFNSCMATYLDLNYRLMAILGFAVLGNLLLVYQTRQGYCKYLAEEVEGNGCNHQFSLLSYLVDYVSVMNEIKNDRQEFFQSIKTGLILSILTYWALPFIFLWQFTRHYEFGLRLKYSRKVKRIENFSLMLSDFKSPGALGRDFEEDFEALIRESGHTDECKIVKSVYSTKKVRVEILKEEVERVEKEIILMKSISEKYSHDKNYKSQIKGVSKRIEKSQKKIAELNQLIIQREEEVRKSDLLETCDCFVTLSSSLARDKILRSFTDKYRSQIYRLCWRKKPKYWISEAPEPSNIRWENFGIHRSTLFWIRLVSYVLIIIVSYILVYLLGYLVRLLDQACSPDPAKRPSSETSKFHMIAIYLVLEVYQFAATFTTKIICKIFDVDFLKMEFIFSEGLSLALLKVLTPIFKDQIFYFNPRTLNNGPPTELVDTFKLIITQSIMKPIMKVFNAANLLSFIKMTWIRIRFALLGTQPLLTQQELNAIFTKPECLLQNIYCEDLYITTISLLSLAYNPGASLACLVYFIVKTIADRLLFLRFYAELKIDSIKLSKNYFKIVLFLIRWAIYYCNYRHYAHRDWNVEYKEQPYVVIFQIFMCVNTILIFFPFELVIGYLCKRVENSHLVKRTDRSEQLLDFENDGIGQDSESTSSSFLTKRGYYMGVVDLGELNLTKIPTKSEISLMSNRSEEE